MPALNKMATILINSVPTDPAPTDGTMRSKPYTTTSVGVPRPLQNAQSCACVPKATAPPKKNNAIAKFMQASWENKYQRQKFVYTNTLYHYIIIVE